MKTCGWNNTTSLKLSLFENTGRGLTSSRNLTPSDTLIEIPYELMISYTTLKDFFTNDLVSSNNLKQLEMHDALAIFLAFERHKGYHSKWKSYINSLPEDIPLVPWLCSEKEIEAIPAELRSKVQDKHDSFKSSWQRSKESINPFWKCECCETPGHRVLSLNLFTWAYVMVNTRAVYVDPDIVRELSRDSVNTSSFELSDDPSMALCPYLDMFNHSCKSATNAVLEKVNGRWMYKLITLTSSEKYNEILISYGSHDNDKLLCEYGFFILNNELDVLRMAFHQVLKYTKVNLSGRQYKFIRERQFDTNLYINKDGLSFNLKAVLFVIMNCELMDWSSSIFSEKYNKDLLAMYCIARDLIKNKISESSSELAVLDSYCNDSSEAFRTVVSYFKYKIEFMERLPTI
ncbi:hypothetical protein ILUMI_07409 [Ignelater luminosus]|uniref:SET domain-containing protein n=1 Tax=Ignelater luminosus TaxID=2038154 RepID=A0A8K0D3Y4_IGNLU|nr:hypothetical protein ILUMI_07409 [Ignelater luminosus]